MKKQKESEPTTLSTTGDYTSQALAQQAADVELSAFSVGDAVELGSIAMSHAKKEGLTIVIEVHHLGRLVFRAAMPGSRVDSDDWIQRKARVVQRFSTSTLAVRVKYEERGTTFEAASGLSETEYAAHGGGFPIVVTGTGVVGAMYVSGLPQVEDHELIVACLRGLKTHRSDGQAPR